MVTLPSGTTIEDLSLADVTNFVRLFALGLSFSSSDEIEAFMRSALGDESYSDNLDSIRAELKSFDE